MDLKFIIESILFSAQQPLSPKELRDLLAAAGEQSEEAGDARAFKKTPIDSIIAALEELAREHGAAQRSYRLACVAGSWQFVSQPEFAPWIKALVGHKNRPARLSAPALETLAIIAYRQPITRAEIEQVRGVAVDGVMQTLVERGLVEQVGRAEVIGRPNTYGTTQSFLHYFGLKALEDLPAADELRRIPVTKPEALLTVDPGLATAPPEPLQVQEASSPVETPPELPATNGHAAHDASTPAPADLASDEATIGTATTTGEAGAPSGTSETSEESSPPRPRNRLARRKSPPNAG